MSTRLDDLLDFADALPSLPAAVLEALTLLNDSDSETEDIVRALSSDQSIVAQLLKLANSAYYGLPRRVASVKQALLVLGRKAVKSLVIAAAAQDYLARPQSGYLLERGQLWEHSLTVGQGSALVATKFRVAPADEAFVAGLLHDIGKVVVSSYLQECWEELAYRLEEREETLFTEIETDLIEVDHATIGGVVAEHWQLPERLVRAIEHHHQPSLAGDDWDLACVVHIANALVMSLGVGLGVDGLRYPVDEPAIVRMGLGPDDLLELTDELISELQAAPPF